MNKHPFIVLGKSWGCLSQNMNVAQCEQGAASAHCHWESFGQLCYKQVENPFTLKCFCNYRHQDGFTNIHSIVLFLIHKWLDSPLFYQSMTVLQVSGTHMPRITGSALHIIVIALHTERRFLHFCVKCFNVLPRKQNQSYAAEVGHHTTWKTNGKWMVASSLPDFTLVDFPQSQGKYKWLLGICLICLGYLCHVK